MQLLVSYRSVVLVFKEGSHELLFFHVSRSGEPKISGLHSLQYSTRNAKKKPSLLYDIKCASYCGCLSVRHLFLEPLIENIVLGLMVKFEGLQPAEQYHCSDHDAQRKLRHCRYIGDTFSFVEMRTLQRSDTRPQCRDVAVLKNAELAAYAFL